MPTRRSVKAYKANKPEVSAKEASGLADMPAKNEAFLTASYGDEPAAEAEGELDASAVSESATDVSAGETPDARFDASLDPLGDEAALEEGEAALEQAESGEANEVPAATPAAVPASAQVSAPRKSAKGRRRAKAPERRPGRPTEGDEAERSGTSASEREDESASSSTDRPNRRRAHRAETTRPSAKRLSSFVHKLLAVLAGLLVALLLIVAYCCADRWLLHDDAADLQGDWYIYGTTAQMPISENTIYLTSDTEYTYEIDTMAKTITYKVGIMSGTSHYRFSADRNTVALIEDGEQVFTATLFDDISWWFASLGDKLARNEVLPGTPSATTVVLQRYLPPEPEAEAEVESDAEAESAAQDDEQAAASEGEEAS